MRNVRPIRAASFDLLRAPLAATGALALALACAAGCTGPATAPPVRPDAWLADVAWLADDARGGRDTGTPELFATAEWVAEKFRAAGLEPAGDAGTYLQHFTVKGARQLLEGNALSVAGRTLTLQTEYMPLQTALSGSVHAPAVFAGYGITDAEGGRDDYAGLDVKGKAVIVLRRGPKSRERGSRYSGRGRGLEHATFAAKVNNAFQHGAAALLIVNDPLESPPDSRDDELPSYRALPGEAVTASLPAARITSKVGSELFAARQLDLTEMQRALDAGLLRGLELTGVTVALDVRAAPTEVATVNVLGYLPGDDAALDGEHVLVGAHMDHLGRGTHSGSRGGPEAVGQVHNGADDNASGTAGVVELARSLGSQRGDLRRGVLFAAWSGEEWGLLGSQHYTEAPARPLDKLVAAINMDMIGRSKGGAVIVEGMGTSPGFRELVVQAHDELGLKLVLQLSDKPSDNSDHASFVRKQIPVINFFTGLHDDYHMPSDDTDKIDAEDGARIASLAGECAVLIADAPARPAFTMSWADGVATPAKGDPGAAAGPPAASAGPPRGGRRVRLGTVPDYAYLEGDGMRLSGTSKDTPAEKAGLLAGDVMVAFDGKPVHSVEDYTVLLSSHAPGDSVVLKVRRGAETLEITVVLAGIAGDS